MSLKAETEAITNSLIQLLINNYYCPSLEKTGSERRNNKFAWKPLLIQNQVN